MLVTSSYSQPPAYPPALLTPRCVPLRNVRIGKCAACDGLSRCGQVKVVSCVIEASCSRLHATRYHVTRKDAKSGRTALLETTLWVVESVVVHWRCPPTRTVVSCCGDIGTVRGAAAGAATALRDLRSVGAHGGPGVMAGVPPDPVCDPAPPHVGIRRSTLSTEHANQPPACARLVFSMARWNGLGTADLAYERLAF